MPSLHTSLDRKPVLYYTESAYYICFLLMALDVPD